MKKQMMKDLHTAARLLGAAGIVGALSVGTAQAADMHGFKDAPAPAGTQLEFSFNAGATTDYVFRGVSQSEERGTVFGGIDLTYGMFYAGVWASGVDFGAGARENVEIDFYGGIKKSYNSVEFDLGVIYYHYPNQTKGFNGAELDYVELKFGASAKVWNEITLGATFYYSPEFFAEAGEALASEASLTVPLPEFAGLSFELSGTLGYQEFFDGGGDYAYWNAGISTTLMEHFTFDVRYWDTDVSGFPLADSRIVGTFTIAN